MTRFLSLEMLFFTNTPSHSLLQIHHKHIYPHKHQTHLLNRSQTHAETHIGQKIPLVDNGCNLSTSLEKTTEPIVEQILVGSSIPAQVQVSGNTHSMVTRSKNGISKLKVYATTLEPSSVVDALQQEQWKTTMTDEFLALIRNKTWSLVSLPNGRKTIGCKWVFKVKENYNETINKYKTRLVDKGFHQVDGFNFNEMFSLVVKPTTIRVVLTIASAKN